MPPIAYDASRSALYSPERHETLFEASQTCTPTQWAIEAARLAYYRAEVSEAERLRLTAALGLAGFGAPHLFTDPGTETFAFGTRHADGTALVAFRGTQPDEIRNLATNLQAHQIDWPEGGGRVHAGFGHAARSVLPAVQAWLQGEGGRQSGLILTGHSLGAALATLVASVSPPTLLVTLVTLGSPRVGNAEFVRTLVDVDILRLVDGCDVVTQVPPALALYAHAGPTSYISCKAERMHNPDVSFIETDRAEGRARYASEYAWKRGNVLLRDLADHAPINYARAYFG